MTNIATISYTCCVISIGPPHGKLLITSNYNSNVSIKKKHVSYLVHEHIGKLRFLWLSCCWVLLFLLLLPMMTLDGFRTSSVRDFMAILHRLLIVIHFYVIVCLVVSRVLSWTRRTCSLIPCAWSASIVASYSRCCTTSSAAPPILGIIIGSVIQAIFSDVPVL